MATTAEWWVGGKKGYLAPCSQAQLWALWYVDKQRGLGLTNDDLRKAVQKVGGGAPSDSIVSRYCKIFEADKAWHPGKKQEGAKRPGPKVEFTPQKKLCVAKAAMAIKAGNIEPTVDMVVARTPNASLNPKTGAPFDKKLILEVFRTMCYDEDPEDPWCHEVPLSKTALSPDMEALRLTWGKTLKDMDYTAGWFSQHVIWTDPCSTIVPRNARQAFDQEQSRKGKGKRWISKSSKVQSKNQRAPPYTGKQCQYGDKRMWWFIVLSRGVVRLVLMGDNNEWTQNGDGMATFVDRLPAVLDDMFGADTAKPRVIFSDRGPGFYQTSQGIITNRYKDALSRHGFRTWAGDDAKWQPPDVPDVLLHETVAAWVRKYFRAHPWKFGKCQETNVARFRRTLKACEEYINAAYKVRDLCYSFPRRIQELIDAEGKRLKY